MFAGTQPARAGEGDTAVPGAKDESITKHLKVIQHLQEEVSKWDNAVLKVKVGSDVEELFAHITGVGHLEVLHLPELNKWDPKSAQAKLHEALRELNNDLVQKHATFQRTILLRNDLASQQSGVKKYAEEVLKALDKIVADWKVKNPPADLKTARKAVKEIRDRTWNQT